MGLPAAFESNQKFHSVSTSMSLPQRQPVNQPLFGSRRFGGASQGLPSSPAPGQQEYGYLALHLVSRNGTRCDASVLRRPGPSALARS